MSSRQPLEYTRRKCKLETTQRAICNPKDVVFCYDTGVNAYHVKPVRYPDHLQRVIDLERYGIGWVALTPLEGRSH